MISRLRGEVGEVALDHGTSAVPGAATVVGRGGADRGRAQVVDALVGLGFAARAAEQSVTAVTAVTAEDADVEDPGEATIDPGRTLRAALNHLSPHR